MSLKLIPSTCVSADVSSRVIYVWHETKEVRIGPSPDSHSAQIPTPLTGEVIERQRSSMARTPQQRRSCFEQRIACHGRLQYLAGGIGVGSIEAQSRCRTAVEFDFCAMGQGTIQVDELTDERLGIRGELDLIAEAVVVITGR